jgi:hypothetical protein
MGTVAAIIGAILLSLAGRWLAVEISVWHGPLCRRLIKFAAGQLPADQRAAAECEWLAIIEDIRSPSAQLIHSISFVARMGTIKRALSEQSAAKPESSTITFALVGVAAVSSVASLSYFYPTVGLVIMIFLALLSVATVGVHELIEEDAKMLSPDWRHPRCQRQRQFSVKKFKRPRTRRRRR